MNEMNIREKGIEEVMKRVFIPVAIFWAIFCFTGPAYGQERHVLLREEFQTLDNWRPLTFPKIKEHTRYTVGLKDGLQCLKAESKGSASALVYRREFNIYEAPRIKWKWMVTNVYKKGGDTTRSGDDYPLRVYILFKYDPDQASLAERISSGLAKKLYGEYPPHSTLSYVWANREDEQAFFSSPYTEQAKLIPLRRGSAKAGTWQEEEVDIVRDYVRVFGVKPPPIASLAIMNDSDNTKEQSVSFLAYIEVFSVDDK